MIVGSPSRWSPLRAALREQVWLLLILAVLAVNGVVVYRAFLAPAPPSAPPSAGDETSAPPEIPDGLVASPLDGAPVSPATAAVRPIAVMVDNLAAARPPAGLPAASVVWETLVEGGVTRLLAVFQTTRDVTVGPVRSARPYFLPWVAEADAVYAHSGGSPEALAALRRGGLDDADEFTNGRAYFRSSSAAPHNLFTTTGRLATLRESRGWRAAPALAPWPAADAAPSGEAARRLTVNFSPLSAYRVQWRYDEAARRYRRSQGGAVSSDRETREQLTAANVVVLFAEVTPAPPPAPPEAVVVASTGRGEAWFFRDGVAVAGFWEKPDGATRTRFTDADGQPFALARGPVWVEVVPRGKRDAVVYGR